MKKITLLSTALVFAASLPAFAATPAEGMDTQQHKAAVTHCEKKAKEHKVSEAKRQSYIDQCVSKEMSKQKTHTKTTPPSGN